MTSLKCADDNSRIGYFGPKNCDVAIVIATFLRLFVVAMAVDTDFS